MFTNDEFDLLMAGLDALESKEANSELIGGLLGIMLARDQEEAKRIADERNEKFEQKQKTVNLLRQRIILLKAKLIQLQDASVATQVEDVLINPRER